MTREDRGPDICEGRAEITLREGARVAAMFAVEIGAGLAAGSVGERMHAVVDGSSGTRQLIAKRMKPTASHP